jgi:hypothetical protein
MRARARLACAVLALAALALAGCTGDDDSAPAETATTATPTVPAPSRRPLPADARLVRRELAGIPQTRLLLGSPQAPVTVVEYSDPTCAPCAATQRGLVRALVERYVRPGVASLELRPLASDARAHGLARSIFAASLQGRGWDMLQLAALRSPAGSGTPTEPDARLAAALGLDLPRWRRDRALPRWRTELLADANVAAVARFAQLPVFLVRGRDATDEAFTIVTRPGSVEELAEAIDSARR